MGQGTITFLLVAVLSISVEGHWGWGRKPLSAPAASWFHSVKEYSNKIVASVDSCKSVARTYEDVSLLPTERDIAIVGTRYKMNGKVSNVRCNGFSNFAITNIQSHHFQHYIELSVTFPRLVLTTDYTVAGKARGRTVDGKGTLRIVANNIKFGVRVQFKMYPRPEVIRVDVVHSIPSVQFDVIGLKVSRLCKTRVKFAVARFLIGRDKDHSVRLNQLFATAILQISNALLAGQSLPTAMQYVNRYAPYLLTT